jgi:hypothetical protein
MFAIKTCESHCDSVILALRSLLKAILAPFPPLADWVLAHTYREQENSRFERNRFPPLYLRIGLQDGPEKDFLSSWEHLALILLLILPDFFS